MVSTSTGESGAVDDGGESGRGCAGERGGAGSLYVNASSSTNDAAVNLFP